MQDYGSHSQLNTYFRPRSSPHWLFSIVFDQGCDTQLNATEYDMDLMARAGHKTLKRIEIRTHPSERRTSHDPRDN